ncbi:MAG: Rrf2 family transcriptional regulator [Paracoccaceae bacterium]|nr:Rrf2 family transcriptional regulator [Paracoccaceae bacterium]
MRLTKFSDYALRALMYAAARKDSLSTIEETAELYQISRAHLKKVVMLLTREGFLHSSRGRAGGFKLALAPEDINLGALLRVTEPDFGLVECFLPGNTCHITRRCHLPVILNEALCDFMAVFSRHTLADILLEERSFMATDHKIEPQRGPYFATGGKGVTGTKTKPTD